MITDEIGFAGLDGSAVTMKCPAAITSADEGKPVSISGNGEIELAANNSSFAGKLLKVESDGFCSVALKGCLELACNDATVSAADSAALCADGSGGIKKTVTTGGLDTYSLAKVLTVDTVNKTAVILL